MRTDRWYFRIAVAALAAAAVVGPAKPASAIIKIDFPVSRLYKEAAAVAVGEVAGVTGGNIECTVRRTLKGRLEVKTIAIGAPATLAKAVKAGGPAVVFVRGRRLILHVADGWWRADRKADNRWVIAGPHSMVQNFPGRTVGLAAIVRDIKAGRKAIQDRIGHEFVGALRDRGNLSVKPTFLTAADADGDGNLDLLVGTAGGVRLFLADDDKYADATARWGLTGAAGPWGAAGDVSGDGKTDLLLGKSLWLRKGDRFVKSPAALKLPAVGTWAAATLADLNGDKRMDVAVLTRTGQLATAINPGPKGGTWAVKTVALWARGRTALGAAFSRDWGDDGGCYVLVVHPRDIVRYPVGNAAAPRSDFKRLTGVALSKYAKIGPMPMQVDLCAPLDYDGNGSMDLLVVTRAGGITLANRRYGAMMINGFMHTQFRTSSKWKPHPKIPKLPFAVNPSLCVAPGKRAGRTGKGKAQNLFLLRADGQLFELTNAR